jgi:hypothetical protein
MSALQVPNIGEPLTGKLKINHRWWNWFDTLWRRIEAVRPAGLTTTISVPPATAGGAAGSMTFASGVLTAYTPPT